MTGGAIEHTSSTRPWAYTAFQVSVSTVKRITPNFLRVTFAGDTLEHFAPWGLDQRIKLVLPLHDGTITDFGLLQDPTPHPSEWYARWKRLPVDERNVLRTYTPSGIRPGAAEVDVDIFIHEPAGPVSLWAQSAQVGDRLVINGPDVRNGFTGYGLHWEPGSATKLLLIGDETAFPAIANIHSSLGDGFEAEILVEASDPLDRELLPTGPGVQLGAPTAGPGSGFEPMVREWGRRQLRADPSPADPHPACPADDLYVWIAGEAGAVTRTRRYLAKELGIPKGRISFLGYWKEGGPLVA